MFSISHNEEQIDVLCSHLSGKTLKLKTYAFLRQINSVSNTHLSPPNGICKLNTFSREQIC